jgi:hypothetical protein
VAENQAEVRGLLDYSLALLALLFAGPVVLAFLLDLAGLPVRGWSVGPLELLLIAGFGWWGIFAHQKKNSRNAGRLEIRAATLFWLILAGVLLYLLWLGRSSALLPVGTTVDAVHQYGLAQYIRDSGKLPIHAVELRANLQDGLEYPPALVTLVALLGGLVRLDVVYLLYPVASLCVALSCGVTFALAFRFLNGRAGALPLAALAATLPFISYGYTFGSITDQNYFAMVLAEFFLLLSLYFLLSWKFLPRLQNAFLFTLTVGALLIDYPTWALIPAAAFGLVALFQPKFGWRSRLIYLGAVFVPLALLAVLFLKDRLRVGLGTVANEGDVLLPDLSRYGWPVVALAAFGLVAAFWWKRLQILALFSGLVAGEGLAFYVLKNSFGQGSYYSVYKLFYPAVFLFALLAVGGLAELLRLILSRLKENCKQSSFLPARPIRLVYSKVGLWLTGFLILVAGLGANWLAHPEAERAYPVITPDMVKAAGWMAQNLKVDQYSVGYGLPPGTPAYWVQVGFLKQPQGNRAKLLLTDEPLTFEQWFYNASSEKYFFTDNLNRVNLDERLSLLYRSGSVGVLTRTPAYEETRTKRQSMTLRYRAELNPDRIKLTAEASFSLEPSQWAGLGITIEPEQGGPAVFEQLTPAEPDRDRQEYMGINFLLPSLKMQELYTNSMFPPAQSFPPLSSGNFTAYVQLYKKNVPVERRKLFSFAYDGANQRISFDPAQRIQEGQFLFDGPLSPDVTLPTARLDFGTGMPQLASYELKEEAQAGQTVPLNLLWFNPAIPPKNYRVILAVLDDQGHSLTQSENVPLNGLFPVWFWPANQPVVYSQNLKLPDKPGRYTLAVALLDPASGQKTALQKLDKPLEVR